MADAEKFRRMVTPSVKFQIPEYQRNYSWTEEELGDLWRDLNNVMGQEDDGFGDKSHFYGMFLFDVDDDEVVYKIIDGQQRITTAIILLNEIRYRLKKLGLDQKADRIRDDYVENRHGFKLKLGPDDDHQIFKDKILDSEEIEQDIASLSDSPSQRRLLKAKEFFAEKLEDKDADFLVDLRKEIDRLEAMSYEVNSITRAVKIFETANDRGRNLSDLDKTKSFLMLQIYLNESEKNEEAIADKIDLLQSRFGKMYRKIDKINDEEHWGSFSEDSIQRFHYILWDEEWTSSRGERYYQNLLSNLKEKIRQSSRPMEQINEYSEELLDAFREQENLTRISDLSHEEKQIIKRMELAGSMGNVRPLLLALRMKRGSTITREEYVTLLRHVETLVARVYVIAQKRAYTARYKIYRLARDVYQEDVDVSDIKSRIRSITEDYADDATVRESLSQDDFYSEFDQSEQRFLLYFYEAARQEESDREKMPYSLRNWVDGKLVGAGEDINVEVEHIHPQTPAEESDIDDYKHRLGNLSILPKGENSSLQNAVGSDKEDAYKEINLEMNKDIVPDLENWGEEQIRKREEAIKQTILQQWSLGET
jgi:cell division protein FtsL